MGLFNRYRADVERVGAVLAPIIGGTLQGPGDDGITWRIAGHRGGRDVVVTLNHMHGIHGLECTIRELGVGPVDLRDDRSIFATSRQPHVAGRITADTTWDAAALWQRLPDLTRHVLATMLEGDSSALRLTRETLDVLLGPSGGLRAPGAAEAIVADLDRLLVIARVMEDVWDIDPSSVGIGRRVWAPEPPPPPPVPVVARDAAVIARLAGPARDAMVARHTAETIPLFPAADPLRNRLSVKDKVVLLPATPPSRWVDDGIHRAIPIGSEADGWYFVRTDDDGCARVLAAVERHRRATSTDVGDAAYEIIGRITGDPSMVVVDGSARIGHAVSVLGARIGIHLFVDATLDFAGRSPYAGED